MDLRQFKFSSDEEIICEVIEWEDDDHDSIVIRKAMKIISAESSEEGLRFYTFKPWASMNNDPEAIHVINSQHILSESIPSKIARETYFEVIKEMKEYENEINDVLNSLDSDKTSNILQFEKRQLH